MAISAGQDLGATRPKPVPLDFRHSRKAAAEEELRKEQEKAQHTQALLEGAAARERGEAEAASEAEGTRSAWEKGTELVATVGGGIAGGVLGAGAGGVGVWPGIAAGMGLARSVVGAGTGVGRAIAPGPEARFAERGGQDLGGQRALQGASGAVSGLQAGAGAVGFAEGMESAEMAQMIDAQQEQILAKGNLTERDMQQLSFLDTDRGQKAYIEGRYPGMDRSYSDAFERYLDEQNAPRRGVYGTPAPAWRPPLRES